MKRRLRITAESSAAKGPALDSRRLRRVRGGDGLGITVSAPAPPTPLMQQQHNEALVRL
jgi:hypothetical protein